MSKIKDLNQKKLKSVNGGVREVNYYQIFKLKDFYNIRPGDKISVLKGSYRGGDYLYCCDGTVETICYDSTILISVKGDNLTYYVFYSNGICKTNNIEVDYWFGPRQVGYQAI